MVVKIADLLLVFLLTLSASEQTSSVSECLEPDQAPDNSPKRRCNRRTCFTRLSRDFDRLNNFTKFTQASVRFLSEEGAPGARSRLFLPSWEELEEEAWYSGPRDAEGRPHGEGGNVRFHEEEVAFVGRRKKRRARDVVRSVQGTFREGLLEGPAFLTFRVWISTVF